MDLTYDFQGKTALVTGASTGIGRATAIALGRSGAKVAVHYNASKAQAEEVARAISDAGGEAFLVQADVASPGEVEAMVEQVLGHFGHVDFLVNNAGSLVERRPFKEMSLELWRRVIDVNLTSVYLVTRAVIGSMLERGTGSIVNVASIAGYNGGGWGASHYAAAKGGVIALTKALALELAGTGIRVNCVNPGRIATPFHDRFSPPDLRKRIAEEQIALRREGTAEEVADVILFLLSDASSYVYGAQIDVNGGLHYR